MTYAFLVDSVEFTPDTVAGRTSLGGSESACLGLARALQARGHDVHIFATKLSAEAVGPDHAGVTWHPAAHFAQTNNWIEWDVVVALRMHHWFAQPVHARLRILWNQDLLLPGVGPSIMAVAWQLDRLVYVSEYHRQQWEDMQPELRPVGWVTKNGHDAALVPSGVTKDPNRIIHISRPERGLEPILAMWPELKKQRPNATLQICRYSSMYDAGGWGRVCASYDQAVQQVNAEVGGIEYLGELGKADLYKAIAEAAVMWYPGVDSFAETSCIAAVEAQANGTPFVGSWKGALPETVPGGILIKGDAMTPAYQAESIAAVIAQLDGCKTQGFGYRKRQIEGRKHIESYTYEVIAAEWDAQVDAWFTERYEAHKPAILKQLLQEDDHCAAKVVAEEIVATLGPLPVTTSRTGIAYIEALEASKFCDRVIAGLEQGAEDYAAHAIQDPLDEMKLSDRFKAVWPRFKDCAHVLDVACGNGSFAIGLALSHPTIHVHGLDYAQGNIDRARDAAERAGVADRCTFERLTVYDFDTQQMHVEWDAFVDDRTDGTHAGDQRFDGLFVGEFVEHVADTALLVDALEAPLAEGALVVYTCPMGPFGELVSRGLPIQRGHVHCFKHDDVRAVWGQKANTGADFFEIGLTPRGNPIGHWIIHYTVQAGRPAAARQLRTRAQRTRPKQTLSVGLITRNAAHDLARCLDSVWAIADEIVIGDTGSQDDTKVIAAQFGARLLDLEPVPNQPEGFAGARNTVLRACTGDWFLWIDADEVLVQGYQLRAYLDGPIFKGLVVHQKHLYQDAAPTFDIPVRVFRIRDNVQFYGCVHEQPQQDGPNGDIYPSLEPAGLELLHTGYLTADVREQKRTQRNLPLIIRDQQVFPTRDLGKVILIREMVLQADANRAAVGGRLIGQVRTGYEHAIEIFLARFDDPTHKLHALARPWYEAALKGLGMGFEVELAIGGKPASAGGLQGAHARPERIWVRDGAELERLVAHQAAKVRAQMEPVMTVKTNPDLSVTTAPEPDVVREAVPA